jgi:predicted exporter
LIRHKRLALAWTLVVALLLAHQAYLWLGQRIAPDTDILALLPVQQRDPVLQQSFTHMVETAQQRVVVLVGASDWDGAKRAADAYGAVLAQAPALLQMSAADEATQTDWLTSFRSHSLVLMSPAQQAQLQNQSPQFWTQSALSALYQPFSGPKLGAWRDDPFGLFAGWMQERAQETPVRPRDGRLFVEGEGKQYILLPLLLKVPAFSMDAQQTVVPLLAHAADAAGKAVPHADVITTGVVLHAAAASAQAGSEVSTIGLGSLIGIVLLTWFTFRSIKPIALILLSIAIGCAGALSVCWLLFGRVHLLTLVFGASLIGVAQDYGIYFLCNRLNADAKLDSVTLLRRLLPGLALTLLAAVIGYAGLAVTPFPGLQQMAVFSALGLIFAWLTVVFWFPALIRGGSLKSGSLARTYGALLPRWPQLQRKRSSIIVCALFAVAVALGCARLGVNDDIRLLQNPPAHLIQDQIRLSKLLDAPTPVQFFLVRGDSDEAVLQREEALKRRLDLLIAQHKLSGYQALSNWVPSAQTQHVRRTLVEQKLLNEGGPLNELAQQTGEDAMWVADTRAHLLQAAAPWTVAEFLQTPASEPWRHLWLGKIDGVTASIVALRGLRNAELPLMQQTAVGLDGVQWVDKVGEISSVLGHYRATMGWVVMVAYVLVFGLLFARYRGRTWRVLAPTAAASLATLALLGWAGQNLQLFHVLALMLLLGVGVDYGIFMQEHPSRRDTTPWLAVGLSAANTILSFGLLALSHTPALRAFGLTMLIGIALVWTLVPCFQNGSVKNEMPQP